MDEKLPFIGECLVATRWGDLDSYGHVNNSRYFEYMTEGRGKVLSHIMTPYDETQYVLVYTNCTFKKSILYPGNVLIRHYLKGLGHTSFTIFSELLSEDGTVFYAEGDAKLVCLDPEKGAPVTIPERLREKLETFSALICK
ncbi:MAG: acyl-CoA thioesterase [Gammaproteobacteria bacterium]